MLPNNDFDALWLTLYGEARGEPIEGIIGVGSVIRNRVEETGKSYLDVCLQGVDIYRHQFSCWNQNDPNYTLLISLDGITSPIIEEIKYVAQGILGGQILDNTRNSNHYLTTNLLRNKPPTWATNQVILAVLGHQSFLKCA